MRPGDDAGRDEERSRHNHGGAIFAIADHAFGIAGNLDEVEETGLSAPIRYFSPPAGGRLRRSPAGSRRLRGHQCMPWMSTQTAALLPRLRIGFKVGARMKRA